MTNFLDTIDNTWTLFLDRDGVLNHEKNEDYIRHANEFQFYDDIPQSFKKLNEKFARILIVTNQRGIGRELMTVEALHEIHQFMHAQIQTYGGNIDGIYFAPDVDKDAPNRKPNIGMGLQAKTDFPAIDFSKSIMIGNNISDMAFGKNLDMKTVYVETTKPLDEMHPLVDLKVDNLKAFIDLL